LIVLHALWDNVGVGRLRVWAESSALPLTFPEASGKPKTQIHPFTLAQEPLLEAISNLAGNLLVKNGGTEVLALRLPSTTNGPLPSPELVLQEAVSQRSKVEFRWWDVVTLMFEPSSALDFLLALPSEHAYSVIFGDSLRFWAEAAKFVLELITRQCFAPALHETQRGGMITCRAAWEAVLSPEDMRRVQHLVQAMPPVCWAFVPPGEKNVSLLQEFVLHFLNHVIDAFVRESLASTSLLPTAGLRARAVGKSLPEQWLRALSNDDPELSASPEELKQFSSIMRTWLEQARPVASGAPFRTCFRLDAPSEEHEDSDTWRVSFHLQANDDPSLLVPAEKVWRERSSTLTFLQRAFENPQERLLADLGKASRLFPMLEQSLQMAHPMGFTLNTEQAYAFLRESAPLLEQSGFGVLVPPWWQKREARVGVKMHVKPQMSATDGASLMGLSSIVDYNWNIAIGDAALSPQEFEKLVSLKRPLVNIRGQWVELRPEEVEAAITFFKKKRARRDMSLGEALRVGLGQGATEVGLPVVGLDAEGWVKDALDRLSNNIPLSLIEEPLAFQGQLRPYQLKGVSWLAFLRQFGFGACLADDMGLGKTIALIALMLHEREERSISIPTLLICPMSIVGNWHRELQRFAPSLSVLVHHGADRLSDDAFIAEATKHDVVITTYALALRDKEELSAIQWEHVVVDEAQNIKNETAKQTQAIKQLKARHRIALTGTPVENRLSELWSIMEFLNPGYLGSATDFRKSFALPIERYHNAEQAATLKNMIQPFVLRRLKTDKEIIRDLPDKMEMKVFCNLTQEQASLYQAVVKEMLEKIEQADGITRRGLVLSTLLKLKQVCNHPAHFMADGSSLSRRSGKLARLEEMLEEVLAEGDKALIFTQFAEMGMLLRQYLQNAFGRETLFLYGGTAKQQRDLLIQRFQEERRGAPLFVLSLKAGGVGLNLTAASHVFHFDRWWNPAVENQATDRAFRIGQQKNVQVHKFVCVGTLEERIDQMIEQKKELAERIVGSGENWLTEMSTAQLRELFALSREAVGE
jgi:SNF2 family DNA or RNA helicase